MASAYALEAVFNLIDKVTKPMNNINKQGDIVNAGLKKTFSNAQKYADKFAGRLKRLGSGLLKLAGISAFLNFDSIKSLAGKGVRDAVEFQTALAKVKTIADTTKVSMKQFSEGILDLSSKTGVAATDIGESVYAAISAGVDTAKAVSFTEVATKAAVGGFTDTATAIDGLTSILNAYGLSADKAMGIADQMLLTQNLGKTSFGAMAQSIKQVIPTAAALNVKTDELFASVASLTGTAGYDTAKAMTGLNRALMGIMKPEGQAAEMAKKLGLNFSAAGLQSRGFAQTIRDIYRATGGNQDIIGKLFGSAEALKVVNVLGGSGSALFEKTLDAMQNATGATQRAFETIMDTPEKRWSIALNKMKNAGIGLGTALLPVVERVIGRVTEIADRIAAFDFSQIAAVADTVFSKIEGFANLLWEAIQIAWQFRGVILVVVGALMLYRTAQLLLNAAMNVNPISLIITLVGLLIFGLIALVKNWDKVTAAVKNNAEKVMAVISIFTGPFGFIISCVKELFTNWHRVTDAFKNGGILGAIKKIGAVILSGLLAPVQGLLEIISHIPGLGHLAGKGAEKIAGLRNSLLGEDANITAKIKIPKVEPPPVELPDAAVPDAIEPPAMDDLQRQLDALDMPSFGMPDASKLHGVVDISNGPSAITHYYAALPGAGAGPVQAIAAPPLTQTVTSAVSTPAVVDNTPQALLSIDKTVRTITALIQSIDTTAKAIFNKPAPAITADMPALRIPAQVTRTPYKPPPVPKQYIKTDKREKEDADQDDPRHIPPVSREERMAYSLQERRETVGIEVSTAQGSQARIVRRPKSPNIKLTTSGGNA
ncbi:MAG: phage tail tape measure protein [Treponema sp.]|jgi:TP901 family phage tail tape measure protein|nr:phage tail tape measure protein [Treponema sp.]